jgi:hypothetical protein
VEVLEVRLATFPGRIADRYYCSYWLAAMLRAKGADGVASITCDLTVFATAGMIRK